MTLRRWWRWRTGLSANTWDKLMPHVVRLTPRSLDDGRYSCLDWEHTESAVPGSPTRDILIGVIRMVQAAGRALARQQPDELLQRSRPLESNASQVIQQILVDVYASLPAGYADVAIKWLLADGRRLRVGLGRHEPEWNPAARLIRAQSPHCSPAVFHDLEKTILRYHSEHEMREAVHWLSESRRGRFGHWFGHGRVFLLPALCQVRRSAETEGMIGVLERKLGQLNESGFIGWGESTGGWITSPLQPAKLLQISDDAWLGIVQNKKIVSGRDSVRWKQIGPHHSSESFVEQFSTKPGRRCKTSPGTICSAGFEIPEGMRLQRMSRRCCMEFNGGSPTNVPDAEKAFWAPAGHEAIEALFGAHWVSVMIGTLLSSFCWLVRDRAKEEWSERTVSKLLHYAKEHPDPVFGELNVYAGNRGDNCGGVSVETSCAKPVQLCP